jgi:hypothetical protein
LVVLSAGLMTPVVAQVEEVLGAYRQYLMSGNYEL